MIRKTIQIGNPALKAINAEIVDFSDSKLHELIQDLTDTMHDKELVGIAACQIGENYKVFITEPRETKTRLKDQADELRVYINPKIVDQSTEKVVIYEGCGSVEKGQLFGPVERPKTVTVEALDINCKKFSFTADGILGRVIQHEVDHLNGIEFLVKVVNQSKMLALEQYLEQIKPDPKYNEVLKIAIKEIRYLSY